MLKINRSGSLRFVQMTIVSLPLNVMFLKTLSSLAFITGSSIKIQASFRHLRKRFEEMVLYVFINKLAFWLVFTQW